MAGRRGTLMVAAAGLLVAVALVGAGTASPDRDGGSRFGDTALTAMAVLVGASSLVGVVLVAHRTRRPPPAAGEPPPGIAPAWLLRPLLVQLLATLFLLSAFLLWTSTWDDEEAGQERLVVRPSTTIADPEIPASPSHGRTSWPVVVAITLAVSGSALAVLATRARRGAGPAEADAGLDDEIAAALDDLDALDRDGDHRRVVIRTYARMERALGRHGLVRQLSETPQEYLGRALEVLGAGGPSAARLTGLFEQARFSTHPVDAGMRADAADALRDIQRRVQVGPTGPTGTTGRRHRPGRSHLGAGAVSIRRVGTLAGAVGAVVVATVVAIDVGRLGARGAVFVAGAVVTGGFVRLVLAREEAGGPQPFARLVQAPPPTTPLASDVRAVEDRLILATSTAGDAHRLLRPALHDVVEEWLLSTHGMVLTDPAAAQLVPAEVWPLLRADARRADDPHAPGPDPGQIDRLIGALEALR